MLKIHIIVDLALGYSDRKAETKPDNRILTDLQFILVIYRK